MTLNGASRSGASSSVRKGLSEFDVGRPIAYFPELARRFGSINAAILFAQIFYWSSRTKNPLGVFKTSAEWEQETGLTYREQVTARRILVGHGVLIETEKRLEHRIYYRLDISSLERRKRNPGTAETASSGKQEPPPAIAENTSENGLPELSAEQIKDNKRRIGELLSDLKRIRNEDR